MIKGRDFIEEQEIGILKSYPALKEFLKRGPYRMLKALL